MTRSVILNLIQDLLKLETIMSLFICSNCGYGSASWMGRCPDCNKWNTLVEQRQEKPGRSKEKTRPLKLTSLSKISTQRKQRIQTEIFEFDRVLGGGIIPGEIILLTGEPGIGKSTLLLQTLKNAKTIYISGEESAEQVKDRAERLKINLKNLLFSNDLQIEGIIEGIENHREDIDIIVIDSVQTIYSNKLDTAPGSVSQLKETATQLITFAKQNKLAVILIGHVTKEGGIAGPKTLEHLVDCVLSFEGERISHHRILRATKNRFGSTDEIGIFEMKSGGLVEVNNPLAFLENAGEIAAGKVIVGVIEGKRPLFFEIQTLVSSTIFASPRRVVKGVDYNKVQLLIAVIKKQFNLPLDRFDIYVNVVGGVSIKSTAADLGIAASLISSIKNIRIPQKTVFVGEVGLLGEVRTVVSEEKIISEARRLKFRSIISAKNIQAIRDLRKILS